MPPEDNIVRDQQDQHHPEQQMVTGGDVVGRDKVVMGDVVHGDKIMGDKYEINIFQRFINYFLGDSETQRSFRNRHNMLKLVWNTWVEGVLKKSLHNEVLIELGMETKPDAVEHPWDMVIQMHDQEPDALQPGTKMLDVFDRTNGALLILGEPGSGKTTMLLELARQAIERAGKDHAEPIPVVFTLSSWTPKQTITEWLVEELKGKYYVSKKIGKTWVENDELLLLIDGLDEVRAEFRDECAKAINAFQEEYNAQLAICSRKVEYEALNRQLRLRGAVLIRPLASERVQEYLLKLSAGLYDVFVSLENDTANRNAVEENKFLHTPLFLSIMVMAYMDVPDGTLEALATTSDYRNELFDAYIEQMFNRKGIDQRYTPEKTKHWLAWLAQRVVDHGQSLFHIEDIQPIWLPLQIRERKLIFGPIIALTPVLIGVLFGGVIGGLTGGLTDLLIMGLICGLVGGLIGGFISVRNFQRFEKMTPTEKLSWSWKGTRSALSIGVVLGLIFGMIFGLIFGLDFGLRYGLSFGLISGLFIGLADGLRGSAIENRSTPGAGIRASFRNLLIGWLMVGLIIGLIFGLIGGLTYGLDFGLIYGLIVGLIGGLIFGLDNGGEFLFAYIVSRWFLYRSGYIPRNLIDFLDYATDRIFLRKVGGGYIFIHRMLMEHFAEMDAESINTLAQGEYN